MSVRDFIPEVWSSKFEEDLKRDLVFAENCNRSYEGDAKKPGDIIRILGLGEVELGAWTDGKLGQLDRLDAIEGTSMAMPINQIRYFRFFVDDLDKRQAQGGSGILSKYMTKAKDAIARAQDEYIASLVLDEQVKAITKTAALGATATDALDAMDAAKLALLENDVSPSTKITVTAPPWFCQLVKNQYTHLDTDNSDMLKHGVVGMYSNMVLKMSNNVYNDGTYDNIQVKTDEAISFVNPYTHLEAYRPDDYFEDVVKGYSLFDGKVTAPKQIINLKVKK